MKKLRAVAIFSTLFLLIAFIMLGYFQSWSDRTQVSIINKHGGIMDTSLLNKQMFSAMIFYLSTTFTLLVLGIAGSVLSIAKWLNIPESEEVKMDTGEQHD